MKKVEIGKGMYLIKLSKKDIRALQHAQRMCQKWAVMASKIIARVKRRADRKIIQEAKLLGQMRRQARKSPYEPRPIFPVKRQRNPYQPSLVDTGTAAHDHLESMKKLRRMGAQPRLPK